MVGLSVALAIAFVGPAVARWLSVDVEPATFVVSAIAVLAIGTSMARRVDLLEQRTLEDPMTCVANRRHWDARLGVEVERAVSSHMPLSMLMVDLDNLKGLNDAHGHGCGDRALGLVAEVLRDTCRSRDVAARFGGDEFAVLLPRTRISEAKVVAERIRSELARRHDSLGLPHDSTVTVSIGVADLDAAREPGPSSLFDAADAALYAAKGKGRDRIEVGEKPGVSSVIHLDERREASKGLPPRTWVKGKTRGRPIRVPRPF